MPRRVKRVVVSPAAVARAGRRSIRASAKLEGRVVPEGHVRSAAVERYLSRCVLDRKHSSEGETP
ncbi:hypothetical protein C3475_03205 [Mycobacterium kansasii]|nr:hypothetical protein C3475_03205 [Mycobacterium kansasii]POY13662.1 hypothetical protein C3474_02475 [Mycobacterium kansasii]